ncbi:Mu transposase domain-containing protein [Bradyrhizobium symbiodeficiens]|uniref:Mu transposase domain-containing protein n=1 Tax=Bradyrhizobium symbiodeficiens TaxID=1404367 RepID=UPI00140F77AE|nr:hypothetical protein [Bradyrhizobium symbiodeficiens]QIO98829.1 hypothetical protein HAU86_02955 [Bradyrhizobium symbiodeficiens]
MDNPRALGRAQRRGEPVKKTRSPSELPRFVGNDCAVEIDANSYSVPWRLRGGAFALRPGTVTTAIGKKARQHRRMDAHGQNRFEFLGAPESCNYWLQWTAF